MTISSKEIAFVIQDAASSKKARDIVILDMRNLTYFTDYFIICSGESKVQVKAIAEEIEKTLDKKDIKLDHIEGYEEANWILLDYGDVIAHVFYDETRFYYDLENLWGDAKRVTRKIVEKGV
ncbi:MAG: ribosome silencing factor [bacterium]|nr:ribosome silencing factor [bacterium]